MRTRRWRRSRHRSALSGQAGMRIGDCDIMLVDDYGHHPARSPQPWRQYEPAGPIAAWC